MLASDVLKGQALARRSLAATETTGITWAPGDCPSQKMGLPSGLVGLA